MDMNEAEEQAPDENVVEEHKAEEGVADEMATDVVEQIARIAEVVADHMDAEEVADMGSPTGISK